MTQSDYLYTLGKTSLLTADGKNLYNLDYTRLKTLTVLLISHRTSDAVH